MHSLAGCKVIREYISIQSELSKSKTTLIGQRIIHIQCFRASFDILQKYLGVFVHYLKLKIFINYKKFKLYKFNLLGKPSIVG